MFSLAPFLSHTAPKIRLNNTFSLRISPLSITEIFDVMIEGQQFEFLGFTLNPVIRMATMRKVRIRRRFNLAIFLPTRPGLYIMVLTDTWFSTKRMSHESCSLFLFYCHASSANKRRLAPRVVLEMAVAVGEKCEEWKDESHLILYFYYSWCLHPLTYVLVSLI